MKHISALLRVSVFTLIILCGACISAALNYDEQSVRNVELVRQDALRLLNQGTKPYSGFEAEVTALKKKIDEIIIYEAGKAKANAPVVNMWKAVRSSTGNLVNIFELWERQGTLSQAFIEESRPRVANLLNSILTVEEHKTKR